MIVRAATIKQGRQSIPVAQVCLATSLGTAEVAAVSVLVDRFITPWPIASGMLLVSAFYLAIWLADLVQQKMRQLGFLAAVSATLCNLGTSFKTIWTDEQTHGEQWARDQSEMQERSAMNESCFWSG